MVRTVFVLGVLSFFSSNCSAWIQPTGILQRNKAPFARLPLVTAATVSSTDQQDILQVLDLAEQFGPVGVRQPEESQQRILDAALALKSVGSAPARVELNGIHNLVYSSAPGGSSGKLGFIDGQVTQTFLDEKTFINAVQVGPIRIALTAEREVKNDTTIKVTFHKTTVSVFGKQLVEKETGGGGVWKYIYAGVVTDKKGAKKLVRVMETPSLFVLEQPL